MIEKFHKEKCGENLFSDFARRTKKNFLLRGATSGSIEGRRSRLRFCLKFQATVPNIRAFTVHKRDEGCF